jgi:hypothetical protein
MPRGDRTGPLGEGPKTGRQMGYCTGHDSPGYVNMYWLRGPGRGLGRRLGRGPGRGFRYGWGFGYGRGFDPVPGSGYGSMYGEIPEVSEKTLIENEIRILRDQLSSLEDRLSKLKEDDGG